MVKEEEIMAEAGGGRGYIDLLGLGPLEDLLCLSPSSYFTSSVVSATTTSATATDTATAAAASSPTCASYLDLAPAYHHMLSFAGQEQYHGDGGGFGFQYQCYGGDHAIPAAVPQKSSPTTECSSSISSMSSSPPATAISAVSCSKPQAFKKKVSRSSDQRKAASAAAAPANAPAAGATTNKKRPRVRKERLGERIMALQQLVSPFGKSDTASVLHEALGYIRFLHDQVQVLSSPYMQRQPAPAPHVAAPESAAGTVVEVEPPRPSDLRSRGLCLMPVHCTDHIPGNSHGNGNGADLWSVAAGMAKAAADNKGAAGGMLLPGGGGGGGHPRQGHLA